MAVATEYVRFIVMDVRHRREKLFGTCDGALRGRGPDSIRGSKACREAAGGVGPPWPRPKYVRFVGIRGCWLRGSDALSMSGLTVVHAGLPRLSTILGEEPGCGRPF